MFHPRPTPLKNENDQAVEWFGTSTDIDDMRRLQEHERVLLAELQHRVRNTLAVIRSIVRRTAQNTSDLEEYTMHLEGRIDAFARAQAIVTRHPAHGVDLAYIVAEELRAAGASEGRQLGIKGPDFPMRAKAAETMALAIHELATNALKYGALTVPQGRIRVEWTLEPKPDPLWLVFRWNESGMRNLAPSPARRGFGMEILERTLAYELKAKTTIGFRPTGLECRIELPLDVILKDEAARLNTADW